MVIEDVERFRAELESYLFRKPEVFSQAHVKVVDPRSTEYIPAAIAELADKRVAERNTREVSCDATASKSWSRSR